MKSPGVFLGLVFATLLWSAETSRGQMFGSRARPGSPGSQGAPGAPAGGTGSPGTPSFGPRSALSSIISSSGSSGVSATGGASLLRGNERFLRPPRRPGEFVGTDARDRREFVGVQPSEGGETVAPAVGPVVAARAAQVAGTAMPLGRRAGAYEPRLVVGFAAASSPPGELSETLTRRIRSIPGLDPANRIEVSVEGRKAVLRGEVVSARDRALAEQLILFEPGIYAVRNDLKVVARPATPPAARPAESPPLERSGRSTLPGAGRAASQPKS